MKLEETAKIIFILKEFYPHSTENSTIENRIRAWHLILKDYDFKETEKAAIEYAKNDSKGFFPAVGQIIAELEKTHTESVYEIGSDYENRVLQYLDGRRLIE